ncbi:MAG: phosphoribosylamine--glycine ligase [Acidobacteria bacterium]|nr:phosphoribosylamine--glycine ligase [Acidobacteriota bacterium]
MRVLVIGSGGREHALVWKLRQSPRISDIYCAPGNGGISGEAECAPADQKSLESLVSVAHRLRPDLTIVGPELPLQLGMVDEFTRRGWPIFGPSKAAAQLETSKIFAKEFMQRHRIPTAPYAVCSSISEVKATLSRFSAPVVVKADGLAAGKGVVLSKSKEEATLAANEMLSGKMLGEAGSRVVIEECLKGDELSFLVFSDGERVVPLVAAQDHKRIGDGDTGPNTGGMGAYSFPGLLDEQMTHWLLQHIARPVLEGMKAEGMEYKGVLYCGLMITPRGPMVLEFNCRFGDPETQPILMRLESDLLEAIEASVEGRLSDGEFHWSKDAAVCVVMASGGYPGTIEVGKRISGIEPAEAIEGVKVFHAGTSARDGDYYTSGGRVLGVSSRAPTLEAAVERAYQAVKRIHFDGAHYRNDIAARALKNYRNQR